MPKYRVELFGSAPVSRTVIVNAGSEKEARKRARDIAKGDRSDLLLDEHPGQWGMTAPPQLIHAGEAAEEGTP